MYIDRIAIQNYKSLKNISMSMKPLSLIVGANASGKSNFADCIDFISEIYRHGLEVAIARKGGYENIAFRRTRRSKQPIRIEISLRFSSKELDRWLYRLSRVSSSKMDTIDFKLEHTFSFGAKGYAISAEFRIVEEEMKCFFLTDHNWNILYDIKREKNQSIQITSDMNSLKHLPSNNRKILRSMLSSLDWFKKDIKKIMDSPHAPTADLLIAFIGRYILGMSVFRDSLESIRVFQLSPAKSREFGVPTPRPELGRSGSNLPAVVDLIKKRHPREWEKILNTMRSILPELSSIDVGYTSSRTLGLFFKDIGSGRPWSVDEISDGTIQTLGLLVALFGPTSRVLVIEEPETSVHPWIIRHILDDCRKASTQKQVIITTHSPIVINSVNPEDVWVIWRAKGQSHLEELNKLDKDFVSAWGQGDIPTFEYLDSGALRVAVPPIADQ